MYFVYSILLALGLVLMLPMFLMRREKYAAGFKQRLGNYPNFEDDGRPVIWLHCVSVGETNAARPLVDGIVRDFPGYRLVVSTTTKTGQELAQTIFAEKADAIVYFPFDFKFSVRRAIKKYKPSLVLLMETEIWPRFIREAKLSGARVAIVNGRLSERSFGRYSKIRPFISGVLADVDLALMQGSNDANRLISLGMPAAKTIVTGNLKFDVSTTEADTAITEYLRERFGLDGSRPLIVAASTHFPEEQILLEAILDNRKAFQPRTIFVPRHPERFDLVADILCDSGFTFAKRSDAPVAGDKEAEIILLDSIGELRAVYPLADIVFVGGSLIPHGGQSVLEPAAAEKAMIVGHFTFNFADAVKGLLEGNGLIQLSELPVEQIGNELSASFGNLLANKERREELGRNAGWVMRANRGATSKTFEYLTRVLKIADS